jgi:futalosine hydrolase
MLKKVEICRMKLLIVSATKEELPFFEPRKNFTDLLITGVGLPFALYQLQKKLAGNTYDCIIQAGLAGSFNENLKLGEDVLVNKDTFGDLGIENDEKFEPLFDTDFMDKNEFPFSNGWLVNDDSLQYKGAYKWVNAITVNTISGSSSTNGHRQSYFDPDIETMEGAALHYVCLMQKIRFLQLRAISNYVGERDKSKWELAAAIGNLNDALDKLIQLLII